jgi:hypothetical protein
MESLDYRRLDPHHRLRLATTHAALAGLVLSAAVVLAWVLACGLSEAYESFALPQARMTVSLLAVKGHLVGARALCQVAALILLISILTGSWRVWRHEPRPIRITQYAACLILMVLVETVACLMLLLLPLHQVASTGLAGELREPKHLRDERELYMLIAQDNSVPIDNNALFGLAHDSSWQEYSWPYGGHLVIIQAEWRPPGSMGLRSAAGSNGATYAVIVRPNSLDLVGSMNSQRAEFVTGSIPRIHTTSHMGADGSFVAVYEWNGRVFQQVQGQTIPHD